MMRCRALVTTAWIAGAMMSVSVPAAEPEPGDEDDEPIEEVLVTGSRTRRSNLDSPSPVIVFDARQLQDLGITSINHRGCDG